MKNLTNTFPVKIYETGINPYAIVLYNVLYIDCSNKSTKQTKAKNDELAELLKWEIKTVKKYLQILKSLNLIVVSGSTRNRSIRCNDPSLIIRNNDISYNKKKIKTSIKKSVNIEKLRSEKWLAEYLEDVRLKDRRADLKLYIKTVKPDINLRDKILLIEKGDISKAATFNSEEFMNFTLNQKSINTEKDQVTARAGDYDLQHKNIFKTEITEFYKNSNMINDYKNYKRLSDCPFELQKLFLSWIEPGLF